MEGIGCYLIFVVMWSILGLRLQVTESLNLFSMLFSLTSAMGRNMMIHVTFYDIPWESMGMCGSLATGTTWGYQHKPTGYKQKKFEEIPWLEPSKVGFASQSLSKKSVANLCCNCKDYDELATGQRREGQFTMARDLVPKICEIPADALPFLLMSCSFASQWDHGPNGGFVFPCLCHWLNTFQPNRELVTSTSQTAHCKPPLQTSCARFRVGKSWIFSCFCRLLSVQSWLRRATRRSSVDHSRLTVHSSRVSRSLWVSSSILLHLANEGLEQEECR